MRRFTLVSSAVLIFVLLVNDLELPVKVVSTPSLGHNYRDVVYLARAQSPPVRITIPKSIDGTDGFYLGARKIKAVKINITKLENGNLAWDDWLVMGVLPNSTIAQVAEKEASGNYREFFGYNSLAPGTACDTANMIFHHNKIVNVVFLDQKVYIDNDGTYFTVSGSIEIDASAVFTTPSKMDK